MKKKLLVFLFFIFSFSLLGQQYPVQILANISAPAPVNFYNYADDTSLNSPITVQIFLNDLTIDNRQIKLKTYFEGGNISFQSKNMVIGADDLFIEGGVPLTLRNTELAPYYRYENIQGIGAATYGQSIPEGSYDFCFEVFDYLTGNKLSAKKCIKIFIFKNEPPILNLPFNGINIEPNDFENIVFQWTPRHLNVSNVEYELSIVEIWDNTTTPQTAFLSQTPIYQETTRATSILYGPDKPQLLPDKRYAWRVQAKALQGLEEIGLFKNEGYSEVFWFSRTSPCQVPQDIFAEAKGLTKINVYWNEDPTVYSDYIIAYREADKPDAHWFTKKTNSAWATIWNLKPGTTYEYKVKGKCTYQYSEYSEVQYVTTEIVKNEDADYQCGIVPDEIAITNREPHPGLIVGSQITAGDFNVVITEITNQSPGALSGKGYVSIPYLNFAKFAVNFSNILVNTDNQLAQGEIVTVYDSKFGEGASMTVDVNVNISEGINGDAGDTKKIPVDFVVDSVTIDANGAIVVTGINANGEADSAIIPGNKDTKIISSNGDVWSVGEDGKITKEEGVEGGAVVANTTNGINSNGEVNQITAEGVLVTFEDSGYYSYDALPKNTSAELKAEYKIIETKNGNTYEIPYKAISDNNGEDFIYADVEITDNTVVKDSVIFKTKEGAKVDVLSWDGNKAKLKLVRKFHYADEEIYATLKNKEGKFDVAGTLITTHLASQELEDVNVVLVSVGATINEKVKEKVKEIYARAGVNINFERSVDISEIENWDIEKDGAVKVKGRKILSGYTNEQLVFNDYLKRTSYYKKKAYYVFVTNIPPSKSDVKGFMPLKSQFGFVFTSKINSTDELAKTIAHELGHGVFGLEHSFDKYNYSEFETEFLMDNSNEGTVLNHLDWKKIHAPGLKLYWFQGVDDGQNTMVSNLPKGFENKDGTYTFMTMNGSYITLPKNVKDLSFVTGIDKLNPYIHYPTGALQSFKIDSVKYSADINGVQNPNNYTVENFGFIYKGFKGYDVEERKEYHKNIITVVPDGDSRRLLKSKVEALSFKENEEVNILKPSTYNKLQTVTNRSFKIYEKNYKYGVTTPYDESYKLNQELVQQFFGEHIDWGTKYFIVSKLAFLNNSYPDIVKVKFPQLALKKDSTQSHIPSDKAYVVLKELDEQKLIDVYVKLINGVKSGLGNCKETLDNITENYSFSRVKNCIDNLSNQELKEVSVSNKIIAISILTQRGISTNNSAEIEIIRLLKFTKNEDVDNLLTALLGKSKTNPEDFLLKRLAYKIDNDHTWLTDDNYKKFVEVLIGLSSKSDLFKKKALEYTDDEFADRIINFYHKSFWDFIKEIGSNMPNAYFYTCNKDTEVSWASSESVDLKLHNEMTCNGVGVDEGQPITLSPLEPIWFLNKTSSLSILSNYNKDTPVLAPAILVYYANDVGDTKNTIDGIEAAIDVVSLATGAGALAKAPSTLRKVYIIADMVGSGVNITLTSSSENLSPNTKIFLESLNILTATIAIDEFLKDGVKSINKLYKKVAKKNTKSLPSKKQVNSFIDNILNENLTSTQIAEIGANKLRESEKWLDYLIAEGKINSELTDLAVRARSAKVKLELAKELLKITPDNLKSVINLTGGEITSVKNYINKSDDYIDVIVHSDKVGDKFLVVVEIEGTVDNIILSAKDFAKTLNDIPKDKTIRLLSCNNVESAQDIAVVLNRNIVASRGEMKLYDNGLIETDSWFIAKDNGKIEDFKPNRYNLDATDEYIILGKKLDDPLLEAIRVGKRSDGTLELALRNAGFNKCADAVKGASKVNANNTKLLDSGDPSIPNLADNYSFIRNGKLFKKGTPAEYANETWNDYFKRLNKILEEQGETVRFFNQFESHHIFPVDLFKNESFRKWYELVGHEHFDINGVDSLENLIMLEAIRRKPLSDAGKPNFVGGVHTNHPKYTQKIGDYIIEKWKDIKLTNQNFDDIEIANKIDEYIIDLSENLKQSLLENSVRGNVELPSYWNTINFDDIKP